MSRHHDNLMDEFNAACEAWMDAAEAASHGYTTEYAEFRAANPPPRLKDWLKAQRRDR